MLRLNAGYSLAMSSVEENISFCSLNKPHTQLAVLIHEVNEPQLVLNVDSRFTSSDFGLYAIVSPY